MGRKGRMAPILLALMSVCSVACHAAASPIHPVDAVRTEAVRFQSGDVTLAGTLFIPDERGRHPAIVLFHGSGPEPRNPSVADWFARHGVIALTYDKRGVGESTGDFRAVSFTELSDDGLAAIQLLRARPDVDAERIGVWGLSQGGWLGPLAASRSKDVKFVIAVSGPGVSPAEQMVFYIKVLPGADHVIRVVQSDGRRTYAPGYLETMEDWLARTLPDVPRSR
jgi:dienelactone hydrolase